MGQRVAAHRENGRKFDKAFYISASDAVRGVLETALLRSLRPADNKAMTSTIRRTLARAIAGASDKQSDKRTPRPPVKPLKALVAADGFEPPTKGL